jgi:ferredoxin-NADP reductase
VVLLSRLRRLRSERRAEEQQAELFRERILFASTRRVDRGRELDTWSGWRKFEVARKSRECDSVYSFELVPHDRKAIPSFRPGQFLTLRVRVPGHPAPVVRCYSLSDAPTTDRYRITVKRIAPPSFRSETLPGMVSSFLCDQVGEGTILDVNAPAGRFCLDAERRTPLVMIAGGVGITPFLSMLASLEQRGFDRDVRVFYGVTKPGMEVMEGLLERLATAYPERFQLHLCYSRVSPDALPVRSSPVRQSAGRVDAKLLRERLPSSNFDFYVCGPASMLQQITADLRAWGVPSDRIAYEAFGPDSVKKAATRAPGAGAATAPGGFQVTFAQAGRSCRWDASTTTLLELAEREGIAIESNCRAGNCGTCWVAIKSGEVEYVHQPSTAPEAGSCLACVAVPASDVVLDV